MPWPSSGIIHALILTSVPVAITVYFFVIWRLWLVSSNDSANNLVFGRPGTKAIYYSWFVLATVSLTAFGHGREGVEESMLKRPKYATVNSARLRKHARIDGWVLALWRRLFLGRQLNSQRGPSSITWSILGIITSIGFVALPLSGLTMEFEAGYYATPGQVVGANASRRPTVTGFNRENWNSRFRFDTTRRTFTSWNQGSSIQPPPGAGVIYTPEEGNRAGYSFKELPNTLPNATGVSNLFLAPQASRDTLIDGRSWGLAFTYSCAVVTELSEFSILNHRNPNSTDHYGYAVLGDTATIEIYNQTNRHIQMYFANNLQAFAEVGYHWPYHQERQSGNAPPSNECYNPLDIPGPESRTMPYPGLENEPQVLEMILWQNLTADGTSPGEVKNPPTLNFTLENTIQELLGAYKTFDEQNFTAPFPMAAIGVRCTSASSVGTAHLDGRRSRFSQFQRADSTPKPSTSGLQCAERLSIGVPHLVFSPALGDRDSAEWLSNFYASVGRFKQGYSQIDYHFMGNQINLQSGYLQAEELRRSLTRAYALYALELAYNGGVGYVDGEGRYRETSEFVNEEAVEYTKDTVLVTGPVPPVLVAVLLGLWAVGSAFFGVVYGFR